MGKNIDDLRDGIASLFGAEREGDLFSDREWPHSRLTAKHDLDFSYFETYIPEGCASHPDSRVCVDKDQRLDALVRNMFVPNQLFESGLRLFADSILAYHELHERTGPLRYYPPVILTFWSAFETFVREISNRFVVMGRDVPFEVADFLLERQRHLNRKGDIEEFEKYHPVLERYFVLLRYGYGTTVDRGSSFWQQLEAAKTLRDYYTHLDVTAPRTITSKEVSQFMESLLLGIIWPSSVLQKTLLLGVFHLYSDWAWLDENVNDFSEHPPLIDFDAHMRYSIPANFSNVDRDRFPNSEEIHAKLK